MVKKKKINKKKKRNTSFFIYYLKILKIVRFLIAILLVLSFIFIMYISYKNNIIKKFSADFSNYFSKIFYDNICSNIEIIGVDKTNIQKLQEKVNNYCSQDNKNNILKLLNSLKNDIWIKNVTIFRKLPNNLKIVVEEYQPFALWKSNNNLHLIDENGIIINIDEREKREYYNLLIIAGKDAKENIYSLFNLLSSNANLFLKIKYAIRVGERRWNLELKNGIVVQMPENNIVDAWNRLDQILSIPGSEIDLKNIDLRNDDRIFLENK